MSARDERPARATVDDVQDESFLRRWARLKQESRQGDEVAQPPAPAAGQAAADSNQGSPGGSAAAGGEDAAADGSEPGADGAEALDLPPIESLTAESDFGNFMQPGVDPVLRRMALRKMWQNPKYGVVDELDPFRADFAAFTPLGDTITADMKFHAERLLREQLEKAGEATGASAVEADEGAGSDADQGAADATAGESGARDESADSDTDAEEPGTPTEDGDDRRHG